MRYRHVVKQEKRSSDEEENVILTYSTPSKNFLASVEAAIYMLI